MLKQTAILLLILAAIYFGTSGCSEDPKVSKPKTSLPQKSAGAEHISGQSESQSPHISGSPPPSQHVSGN